MKLSQYAKQNNITYKAAYEHWKKGIIKGKQLPTGTIVVEDGANSQIQYGVILYARVSSSENKINLDSQIERLKNYAAARGYKVAKEIKEIGSGLNDNRKQLTEILSSEKWDVIVVEHKDRLTRFGFNYIETLCKTKGKTIEVINNTDDKQEDLMGDLVSIVTSFCARIYGLRRSKRKTEKLISELTKDFEEQSNE
jgi:predicted site-specific integrase-resolvase